MSTYGNDTSYEAEHAKLEVLRDQFVTQTVSWLQEWYRQCAYGYAARSVQRSLQLGGEGLRQFRLEVDAIVKQTEQTVAYFLDDGVWWHADSYMTRSTFIYSVRLCMGRLMFPLSRFGFLQEQSWREAVKIKVTNHYDNNGMAEREDCVEFHLAGAHRPFFRCDDKDKTLPLQDWSTDGWSAGMLATLNEYFITVDRVEEFARTVARQREAETAQEKLRAVKEAFAFAALTGDEDKIVLKKPSLSELFRARPD